MNDRPRLRRTCPIIIQSLQSLVAGLLARGGSLILLVLASRSMGTREFGRFGFALSAAVTLASAMTLGPGDQIAYSLARGERLRRHSLLALLLAPIVASSLLVLYVEVVESALLGGLAAGAALCVSSIGQLVTLHILRGMGRPGKASMLVLGGSSMLRVVAISVLAPHQAEEALVVLSVTNIVALVPLGTYVLGIRDTEVAPRAMAALSTKGIALGMMWVLLQQVDIVWLGALRGAEALAGYLPTMRLAEAATLLAASTNLVVVKEVGREGSTHALWRNVRVSNGVSTFAFGCTTLLILRGPMERLLERPILPILPTVCLIAGYVLLVIGQPSIGRAYSSGAQSPYFRTALVVILITTIGMGLGVAYAGATGAAFSNALAYGLVGVWLLVSGGHAAPRVAPAMTSLRRNSPVTGGSSR